MIVVVSGDFKRCVCPVDVMRCDVRLREKNGSCQCWQRNVWERRVAVDAGSGLYLSHGDDPTLHSTVHRLPLDLRQ